MVHHIHNLGSKFAVWSTVVDDYVTELLTRDELFWHLYKEHCDGENFLKNFENRMDRVIGHGCSAYPPCKNIKPFIDDERDFARQIMHLVQTQKENRLTYDDLMKIMGCKTFDTAQESVVLTDWLHVLTPEERLGAMKAMRRVLGVI